MKKVLVLFFAIAIYGSLMAQEQLTTAKIKNLKGQEIDFSNFVQNSADSIIVLSFWATWCIPCVTELENISDNYIEQRKKKSFRFIAVSIDDNRTSQRVKPFVAGKGWTFDVWLDVNNDLKRNLNVTDVPHVIIIKNQKIVYRHTGYISGDEDQLFEKINNL